MKIKIEKVSIVYDFNIGDIDISNYIMNPIVVISNDMSMVVGKAQIDLFHNKVEVFYKDYWVSPFPHTIEKATIKTNDKEELLYLSLTPILEDVS